MYFSRIFDLKFIFNPGLGSMTGIFSWLLYVICGIFLLAALVSWLIYKKETRQPNNLPKVKLWWKLVEYFFYVGLIGLILVFFRQQKVYFLSMPFFFYLWVLTLLVWGDFILRWVKLRMRRLEQEIREKKEKEKYLG